MTQLVRKLIVFNVDDDRQRELLEWVTSQTCNFSGYVKDVLIARKGGDSVVSVRPVPVAKYEIAATEEPEELPPPPPPRLANAGREFIVDIF